VEAVVLAGFERPRGDQRGDDVRRLEGLAEVFEAEGHGLVVERKAHECVVCAGACPFVEWQCQCGASVQVRRDIALASR